MKALLSAPSSLSRCLLRQSSTRRECVTTVVAAAFGGRRDVLCAVHEHRSHQSNDVSRKIATNKLAFHISHSCWRLMGTSAQEEDIDFTVQEANERYSGQLQIKRVNPDQWGVFAHRPYTKGSIVISSNLATDTNNEPNPKATSCSHAIQTNFNEHILMDLPAQFLNHSCDPNIGVAVKLNEGQSYDFVALRDIQEGEEVRFDYETTEYEVGAFEDCMCGAGSCRGTIKGFKYNRDVILEKYGGKNIAAYLME